MPPGPRRTLALAALLAGALALACSRPEPLRVGFVSGLTGRHYDLGISSRNGATLAIAELNAAGGVGGRPLSLLVKDDEQRPEAATRAVKELIAEGALAIVGHATSAMAEVTLPIVNEAHVLMVSPTVSASAFKGRDDWFVMLYPSADLAAGLLARHAANRGVRQVAVIYDLSNRAYAQTWRDQFAAALVPRGGSVVRDVPYTSGQVESWAALVAKAVGPGGPPVEGVLIVANALDSATLAQQVRKRSADLPIFGTDWGFTHDVMVHGGSAVEGAVFTQKINVDDRSPRYLRFREAYELRFNRPPDFAAISSYEAVLLVAEGLRDEPTREGVRRSILRRGGFAGLQADVRIDRFGDADRPHLLMAVKDGKPLLLP